MDKWRLMHFFYELIKLGIKMPGNIGSPISKLLEDMCTRQDAFLQRIAGDYTNHNHEYRLNNAGPKMYWHVEKSEKDGWRRFKCSIGGDQAKDYPGFVAAANRLIKDYSFNKR